MSARSLLRATAASSVPTSSNNQSGDGDPLLQDPLISIHPKTKSIRCVACDYQVIKHLSLWSTHCQSKPHRQGLAKIRKKEEEERKKRQSEVEQQEEKRRLEENQRLERERVEQEAENERQRTSNAKGKRKADNQSQIDQHEDTKKSKANPNDQDKEWLAFQREVLGNDTDSAKANSVQPLYNHATVISEPQLNAKPQKILDIDGRDGEGRQEQQEEQEEDQEESREEKRRRLDREEKEEIYQRYMEEIRNQDEVDERVTALKNRLELLKSKRVATPSFGPTSTSTSTSSASPSSSESKPTPSSAAKAKSKSSLAAAMAMAARNKKR